MNSCLRSVAGFLLVAFLLAAGIACADDPISVTLAWDPSPDARVTGYFVYAGPAIGPTPAKTDVGSETVFEVTNLVAGVRYVFFVTAYDRANLESDPSNGIYYTPDNGSIPFPPEAVPNAPRALTCNFAGTNKVALRWQDGSTNETGFLIERSLDGYSFFPLDVVGANQTTYIITNSSDFRVTTTPYWFRVAAFRGNSLSDYSNLASPLAKLPDLAVLSVSASPAQPAEGGSVVFSATISNLGKDTTPQGTPIRVSFSLDGGPPVQWVEVTNTVAPAETLNVTADSVSAWVATTGEHVLSVVVDERNDTLETDESNNSLSTGLVVSPDGAPTVTLQVDRAEITERDTLGGRFTLTRAGDATNDLPVALRVSGSAVMGKDCSGVPAVLVIPEASPSAEFTVTPVDSFQVSPDRLLHVSVVASTNYLDVTGGEVTLRIRDTDVDPDGDGMSDRAELLAGTDPADASSALKILLIVPGDLGGAAVTWASAAGITYRVLTRTDLGATWEAASPQVAATGGATTWVDARTNAACFYTVATEPPGAPMIYPVRLADSEGAVVDWSSVPGVTYRVLARAQTGQTNWMAVSPPITASRTFSSWTDPSATPGRYYEVVVDPESPPRILSVQRSPTGEVLVRWSSAPGIACQLLAKSSLAASEWAPVSSPVTAAGPVTTAFHQSQDRSMSFYRILALPPPPPKILSFQHSPSGTAQLTWSSVPGMVYQLRGAVSLFPPRWMNLSAPMTATGLTTTCGWPLAEAIFFCDVVALNPNAGGTGPKP